MLQVLRRWSGRSRGWAQSVMYWGEFADKCNLGNKASWIPAIWVRKSVINGSDVISLSHHLCEGVGVLAHKAPPRPEELQAFHGCWGRGRQIPQQSSY